MNFNLITFSNKINKTNLALLYHNKYYKELHKVLMVLLLLTGKRVREKLILL